MHFCIDIIMINISNDNISSFIYTCTYINKNVYMNIDRECMYMCMCV